MPIEPFTLLLALAFIHGSFTFVFGWLAITGEFGAIFHFWAGSAASSAIGVALTVLQPDAPFYDPLGGCLIVALFGAGVQFARLGGRAFHHDDLQVGRSVLAVLLPAVAFAVLGLRAAPEPSVAGVVVAHGILAACTLEMGAYFTVKAVRSIGAAGFMVGGPALLIGLSECVVVALVAVGADMAQGPPSHVLAPLVDLVVGLVAHTGMLMMTVDRAVQRNRLAALTDPLTMLANRRGFLEMTRGRLGSAFVLLVDLDAFKTINDRYGHACGDRVLAEVSGRLQESFRRRSDAVARWGGEEFLVAFDAADTDEAFATADRFRAAIARTPVPIDADGRTIPVTVSGGIARVGNWNRDLEQAIGAADRALYRAKRAGRNRICLDVPETLHDKPLA